MRPRSMVWLGVLATILAAVTPGQGAGLELWYWQSAYPNSASKVSAIETQIDLASSYGYTGVAFWSSSFTFMGSPVHPAPNVAYMQQLVAYAQAKGMKTMASVAPYGYSDDALINNPNWAEGQHLTGSRFTVNSNKTALAPANTFAGLANPDFESGLTGWFGFQDPDMGIDSVVRHSGTASGYVTNASGNARFGQTLNVTPWRQYHGRIWIKTSAFSGYAQLEVWDPATNTALFYQEIGHTSTADWTLLEFTFNSRGTTQPLFLFGVWGGSTGRMWFDDALIEETSLVYVLRRPGTPLKAYDPANPNTVYQEGTDFNPIADPQLASGGLFTGFYHAPATVALPASTSLQPGQTVAIDYYAVQPVGDYGDVGICLTETGAQNWLRQNLQSVVNNMPSAMSYLLSYDEMRHMNSCEVCRAKNLTAGQLLAGHVASTSVLMKTLAPAAPLYVWSDMFDPFHNAISGSYYFVEGSIAGSWAGLPSNTTVMNWNLGNLKNSLTWFSGLNTQQRVPFRQIVAGYYDSGDGAASASQEVQKAIGIPGIDGLMYTTWRSDYSQLQSFALAAKNNWASYVASVPTVVTAQFTINPSAVTYSRATGKYNQTVSLVNNGPALTAAAWVLDSVATGVSVYQPDGTTVTAVPSGSPYKEIGAVGAGASVTFAVQFSRTGTVPLTYSPRILGAGQR